jgi:hypothetical protein
VAWVERECEGIVFVFRGGFEAGGGVPRFLRARSLVVKNPTRNTDVLGTRAQDGRSKQRPYDGEGRPPAIN